MGGEHHHHHHIDPETGDKRVGLAIAVNMGLTVAQIIGGILSGSLALIADALHNFSDAISLLIAFWARKIARRPANSRMTYGYGRAEVVAALVNYTSLILIGIYLAFEAVMRLIAPEPVNGWFVVILAGVALLVDAITALLTLKLSKESMNIRAAFLHNLADALGSVAVIIAGVAILVWDWRLIDPLVTLLIAGYILYLSVSEIRDVIHVLMLGAPSDIAAEDVFDTITEQDGVEGAHHLHLWQMQEHEPAVNAHVVIADARWDEADAIKSRIKHALHERFHISHITIEVERVSHDCADTRKIGHA